MPGLFSTTWNRVFFAKLAVSFGLAAILAGCSGANPDITALGSVSILSASSTNNYIPDKTTATLTGTCNKAVKTISILRSGSLVDITSLSSMGIGSGTNSCASSGSFSVTLTSLDTNWGMSSTNASYSITATTTSAYSEVKSFQVYVVTPSASIKVYPGVISSANVSSFVVSGTCVAMSSLRLSFGGSILASPSCVGGTFSATITTGASLADGTFFLYAKDASTSTLYDAWSITKDTTAPVAALTSAPPNINSLTTVSSALDSTDTAFYSYKAGPASTTVCTLGIGYSAFIPYGPNLVYDLTSLPDTDYRICLLAKDAAGNTQSLASATSYTWTKNTVLPTAILGALPAAVSNATSLAVTVSGTGITQYKYKFGNTASINCAVTSGYSTGIAVATTIVDSTGASGNKTLCVIGYNGVQWQTESAATIYNFRLDLDAPTLTGTIALSSAFSNSTSTTPNFSFAAASDTGGYAIAKYQACVGSSAFSCDVRNWSDIGTSTSFNMSGLSLSNGPYYISVRAVDLAGNISTAIAGVSLWLVDTTPPTISGTLADGSTYPSLTQSPMLTWPTALDGSGSGIQKYKIAIGTSAGGSDIFSWTDVGNVQNYQVSGLSLTGGATYYPSVKAVDKAGNESSVLTGDGWIANAGDTTPPAGPFLPMLVGNIVSNTQSPMITWDAAADPSGISRYDIRLLTSADSVVIGWMPLAGTTTQYMFTGLSLAVDTDYKIELRAVDGAGTPNIGASVQSSVWRVIPDSWKMESYLKADNKYLSDKFGSALAISGDTMVIGAPYESNTQTGPSSSASVNDHASTSSGAAYVYRKSSSGWTLESYLKSSDSSSGDRFGFSVAIDGDRIVVGAPGKSSSKGRAYVFKRFLNVWAQEDSLSASNGEGGDLFGTSVGISSGNIVVGAIAESRNQGGVVNCTCSFSDNNSALQSGAAYVFKYNGAGWNQSAYLKTTSPSANEYLGSAVSIDGDLIAVSAPSYFVSGTGYVGRVFVYERNPSDGTWSMKSQIAPASMNANYGFGASLALHNGTLAVGAPGSSSLSATIVNSNSYTDGDDSGSDNGAVYIYRWNTSSFLQEAYIKSDLPMNGDRFGESLTLVGDTLAVGTPYDDNTATAIAKFSGGPIGRAMGASSSNDFGSVTTFTRVGTTWSREYYLKAPNAAIAANFGKAIALDNDRVIVAAPSENGNSATMNSGSLIGNTTGMAASGSAYVFKRNRTPNVQQTAYIKSVPSPSPTPSLQLGAAVAIDGKIMVAGAPNYDSQKGAAKAYWWNGSTWTNMGSTFVTPTNGNAGAMFGKSIAVSGTTMVIGAPSDAISQSGVANIQSGGGSASTTTGLTDSGAAYVYVWNGSTWTFQAYLKASNSSANAKFGTSVAIDKDTIVVGAPGDASSLATITNSAGNPVATDTSAVNSGAVYVFKRSGIDWTQVAYIKAKNSAANNMFGYSVGISKELIIVGAPGDFNNSTSIISAGTNSSSLVIGGSNSVNGAGSVHVFRKDISSTNWEYDAFIKPPATAFNASFGSAVAISGNSAAVSAIGDNSPQNWITNANTYSPGSGASQAGAVFTFKRSGNGTWDMEASLKAFNNQSPAAFGNSISLSGDKLVVGALQNKDPSTGVANNPLPNSNVAGSYYYGAAYIFKRNFNAATGAGLWSQHAYLKPGSITAESAQFGSSVAISGNRVAVGAKFDTYSVSGITSGSSGGPLGTSLYASGAVYIFEE